MYLDMKTNNHIPSLFQKKNMKRQMEFIIDNRR